MFEGCFETKCNIKVDAQKTPTPTPTVDALFILN